MRKVNIEKKSNKEMKSRKEKIEPFAIVVFYLLDFPFLVHLHPAISGIILVLAVFIVSLLSIEALRASYTAIITWFYS
jgi:hypothetical protein